VFTDWRPASDASFALVTSYARTAVSLLVLTAGELAIIDRC
jgi:hypothetical protein